MKIKTFLQISLAVVLLIFFTAGGVGASFYIPYIYGVDTVKGGGDDNPYPKTQHFDWITTSNPYGYNTAFTYSNGSNLQFNITFTLYAPDNWNTEGGIDYTGYRPNDDGYVRGTNVTSLDSGSGAFNDVYSYYYTIENTGTDTLQSIDIYYSNATLDDFGYTNDYETVDSMVDTSGQYITITFDDNAGVGNGAYLATGDKSTFYLSSQSWYGLGSVDGNSESTTGSLPSPNPEAPVVALYLIGLMGTAAYACYLKKNRAQVL